MNDMCRIGSAIWGTKKDCGGVVPNGTRAPVVTLMAASFDAKKVMDFLHARPYALSPHPLDECAVGDDFEDRHKTKAGKAPRRRLRDRY